MTANGKAEQSARIGVISDTHGILHPAVPDWFQAVRRIVHAGDIGHPDILVALGRLAPVTAVRGNMDSGTWATALPVMEFVEFQSLRLCVLHDRDRLDFEPRRAGIDAVVSGHTHRPHLSDEDGVLFINPGSASDPRHRHPPTVALLEVVDGHFSARLIELDPRI
ncbi:MAG: hypothetical protein AMJ54_10810 [Deltaproteobacteria bacterium SG8_13]|nr:MAG: hypothetical protein AMJ54_10810 [Deltaproteobacteria bacterium SG8_13]